MVGQFTMVMSILIHPWKLAFGTQKRRFVYDVPFQKGKVICRFKMLISRVYKSSHIPSSNHPMISNRIVLKTSLKNSDKWGDRPLLVREIGKFHENSHENHFMPWGIFHCKIFEMEMESLGVKWHVTMLSVISVNNADQLISAFAPPNFSWTRLRRICP